MHRCAGVLSFRCVAATPPAATPPAANSSCLGSDRWKKAPLGRDFADGIKASDQLTLMNYLEYLRGVADAISHPGVGGPFKAEEEGRRVR